MSASLFFFAFWQLPTYSGTKSYQNLLVEVYGMVSVGDKQDTSIQENPLSFIRSGSYYYDYGNIYYYNSRGYYWEADSRFNTHAHFLDFRSDYSYLRNYDFKGYGKTIRCLVC